MDEASAYAMTWHEDDQVHQAEGALAERLNIDIHEAVRALRVRAKATGLPVREAASQVLNEGHRRR